MKTPMQEHIEWLKKEKDEHGYERGLHYETAIEFAESMLEKEKEVMCYFAKLFYLQKWDMELGDAKIRSAESCFDETFKTKER